LHVHHRNAKTDSCGRSFAVVSTQVSIAHRLTCGSMLEVNVPGPMPAAEASRCCRRRSQQFVCACGS
jgi:hypothetical protein